MKHSTSPPAVAPAPLRRIGVITNPHSGRNVRALPRLRGILAALPQVSHAITSSSAEIPATLARMAAEGVNVVAVNGGDGSVAHVLTALQDGSSGFAEPPLLVALPGGTTNVTVGDIGIRGGIEAALCKLLAWQRGHVRGARVLERPVIGVRAADGGLLGCGLVFGAGAVVDGIEYWHEQVRARGMRSELSSGVAMTRTVWGMVHGQQGFADAVRMRIELPREAPVEGEFMLLVVSALERLFLGIHPFWGSATGALRLTAIARGAPGFARALPSILRGRPLRTVTPENGYHSTRFDQAVLHFNGGFTLDGEIHHLAANDGPVTLYTSGRARFLRI